MCKLLICVTVFFAFSAQTLKANTYPRPLQILLEDVEDIAERARLIRIYQRPVSPEDKKLVREAHAKAAAERNSKTRKGSNKGGKKKGNKKKR